jgi:hydroxymethylpyrimidine/phosphomethylpyrimidine kinase
MKPNFPIALSIAGFDGSGGAGMQADLKTFSARGVYAATVLTSLPIQNTTGVQKVYDLPIESISEQIDSMFEDLNITAVKVGMLHKVEIIKLVSEKLSKYKPKFIIVDPVMVAKSGHRLLQEDAVTALKEWILPLATVLTPNIPEAEDLLGRKIASSSDMEMAGKDILKIGRSSLQTNCLSKNRILIVKGGHAKGEKSSDCVVDEEGSVNWFHSERIQTKNTHGTGCTFSAAITAELAKENSPLAAIRTAKDYLAKAIFASKDLEIGRGNGPVQFFYEWW